MRKHFIITPLVLLVMLTTSCQNNSANTSDTINIKLEEKAQFDNLMQSDLTKYFSKIYASGIVKWELLRDGPTSSGVSYPKYYLWVKIFKEEELLTEGALRVIAIGRTSFEVTDFVEINEIRNKTIDIYTIFPKPVCEKIETRL